jgi:hypothetical protein
MQTTQNVEYESQLKEFCDSYLIPPSQPQARRTYRAGESSDMAELSLRFMGIGTDCLVQTLQRSRGLTPMPRKKERRKCLCGTAFQFPPGQMESRKDPEGDKRKVENLHRASIGEVCFTDTFKTTDTTYRYGQVVGITVVVMEMSSQYDQGRRWLGHLWSSAVVILYPSS